MNTECRIKKIYIPNSELRIPEHGELLMRILFAICILLILSPILNAENIYPWLQNYDAKNTIAERIKVPEGYTRVKVKKNSFADWLRHLPLKPKGTFVRYWNGGLKSNQDIHVSVVDMDLIGRDLQQCADAVIRLRVEYLWSVGKADEIQFSYSCSREPIPWKRWKEGWRTKIYKINGRDAFRWVKIDSYEQKLRLSKLSWPFTSFRDDSRENFKNYLYSIMMYAGTWSLSKDMNEIISSEVKIGDAFVQGALPGFGHAVLILDMAVSNSGKKIMLLGQSYMPAQDFHMLKNSQHEFSPWYDVNFGETLNTPQWTFQANNARRFQEHGE